MFKAARIAILLLILLVVAVNSWLAQARSTDWNNSLWVKIYPINAAGDAATASYLDTLSVEHFADVEEFVAREVARYGHRVERPVRMELGVVLTEQPPSIGPDRSVLDVMLWSLRMRWWVHSVTSGQDRIEPDVSIFVRFHEALGVERLDDSVGVRKGMFGVVNAYTGRQYRGTNNVIIAHELLHTLGATDKYEPASGQPLVPDGLADPDKQPLYPQTAAEIMGGRVALGPDEAVIPQSLAYALIGPATAAEIGLVDD